MVLLNRFHKLTKAVIQSIGISCLGISAHAGTLAIFNPLTLPQQDLIFDSQILVANDAFSLGALMNDFEGKFYSKSSQNYALRDIRIDLGTYNEQWGYLGYVYRVETSIGASADAVRLIHQVSNEADLDLDKTYNLDMQIEGFIVHGMSWANRFTLYRENNWKISVGVGLELLYATGAQHGYVRGNANAIAVNDYDFSLNADYVYTDNYLYDLNVPSASAFGYTTHFSMQLAYENFTLTGVINDLWGKLYWKSLPYSQVMMSSGTKHYDENGYVNYSPAISGIERNKSYTQDLVHKGSVEASYQYDNEDRYAIGVEHGYHTILSYGTYAHKWNDEMEAKFMYDFRFGMAGADIHYRNYRLGIYTNSLIAPSAMKLDFSMLYRF